MPTVLFSPALAGLAHVVRCLAVAERMPGYKCIIIVEPSHRQFILNNYTAPKHITFIEHKAPFYSDMKFWKQAANSKFPEAILQSEIQYYLATTKKLQPDLVVGDSNLFGVMAARILGIPHTLLAVMTFLPYYKRLVGLSQNRLVQKSVDTIGAQMANKKILSLFDKTLLGAYRRQGIDTSNASSAEVIRDFDKILFEDPDISNLAPTAPNLSYFPLPIAQFEVGDSGGFNKLKTLTKNKRVAYVTMGGTGYDTSLCKALVQEFLAADYFVICSTAQLFSPSELPDSANLYSGTFLPGYAAAALADVMVSHGSQGTIAQAIRTGTPLFAIPFHVDQYIMLDIQTNPLIHDLLRLNVGAVAKFFAQPSSLLDRPGKLKATDIVAMANKVPKKAAHKKQLPKIDKDAALIQHLIKKIQH